jgi:putative hydrolase of the HAD superfamily
VIRVIAFDGDDTLWHNETVFSLTQQRFRELLGAHVKDAAHLDERLHERETVNLALFGYGIKGFTLSMIETAIEVTGGAVSAREIQLLIDAGKAMLQHPVELLDGVPDTLEALAPDYKLMLVTKGDLFDQESKIARSGLAGLFWRIEILTEKDVGSYGRILRRHRIAPGEFCMVGNSPRSDIAPVTALGGSAILIPYPLTWAHEADHAELGVHRVLGSISQVPLAIQEMGSR